MLTTLNAIAALTVTEPAAGTSLGTIILGVLALVFAVAATLVMSKLNATRKALKALTVEHQSTSEAHRALMDKERKLAKELEAKKAEYQELKQDLGAQKKKGFGAQEETKGLRAEIKRLTEEVEHVRHERSAYDSAREVAKSHEPKAKPIEAKPVETKPEPKAEPVEAKPTIVVADTELAARAERLEAQNKSLSEALRAERDEKRAWQDEQRQARKRTEALRRIDIITKGKVEVLEDRLKGLGRQYYEAVSELAVLKGEVAPPRPRDLDAPASETPSTDEQDAAGAAAQASALPTRKASAPAKENTGA